MQQYVNGFAQKELNNSSNITSQVSQDFPKHTMFIYEFSFNNTN